MTSPAYESVSGLDFPTFFAETHSGKREPFPWQRRLAEAETLPEVLDLPTGSGKTSILDILLWRALRDGEIPRLVYVVDRRLVVDDVFAHAERLAERWGIQAQRWRGGLPIGEDWLIDPTRPTVLVSTVDQIGSRLLFRGYGVSWKERSIHAGLLGLGTTLVLDEVHLSRPFANTLREVARQIEESKLSGWPRPLRVLEMSATPGGGERRTFQLGATDHEHSVLARRLSTHKLAKLMTTKNDRFHDTVVTEALRFGEDGQRVGIIVNRAGDARAIFERLRHRRRALLLTGRIREIDRDHLGNEIEPLRPVDDRPPLNERLFVVATQTLEVGVDVDFDALISEAAPLSALRQRFGRLDRLGNHGTTRARIILRTGTQQDDPIYGDAIGTAWAWLQDHRTGPKKTVDLGLAIDHDWPTEPTPTETRFPTAEAEVLAETHPHLAVDVNVARLLHGDRPPPHHVSVVWRQELATGWEHWLDLIGLVPPVRGEMLPVPRWEVRKWLRALGTPALVWRSGEEPFVVAESPEPGQQYDLQQIRPEDVVVVPCHYGGCDEFGWNRLSAGTVVDVGNQAYATLQPKILRFFGKDERSKAATDYPADLGVDGGFTVYRSSDDPRSAVEAQAETLAEHRSRVLDEGRELLEAFALPEPLCRDLLFALREHDEGKRDARFQVMLFGGDEIGAAVATADGEPRAKSDIPWWNRRARRLAFEASGLPRGWRHELASLDRGDFAEAVDEDLVRHLVAAHHGRGRPRPLPGDGQCVDTVADSNRYWRLVARYGVWGLAFLEALVRVADRRASAPAVVPEEGSS